MTKRLTPEEKIRRRWVKALRSGKYKQGRNNLRSLHNEFCCLGVLCELAVKEGVIPEAIKKPANYNYLNEGGYPPEKVKRWAGLNFSQGVYTEGINLTSLASKNDQGETFDAIATIIESNPEGLFTK